MIVVIHSVGPILLETILSQPSIKAIIWAGLPGQESGNALTDILFGSSNPSGKLPYTIAKNRADYGAGWINSQTDPFTEGIFIDYRHFDHYGLTPRYEFGFGLSYTEFSYSELSANIFTTPGPAIGSIVSGGPVELFESVGSITVQIVNSGQVEGSEVAQLYIGYPESAPPTPPKQLRGFEKVKLSPGQAGTATFEITRRDLSYWDTKSQKWVVPSGSFKVFVGASSRDIRQQGTFTV